MPLTGAQKSAAHRTRVAERNRIRDVALRQIVSLCRSDPDNSYLRSIAQIAANGLGDDL